MQMQFRFYYHSREKEVQTEVKMLTWIKNDHSNQTSHLPKKMRNEKNPSNKSARQNTSRGLKNRSATIPRPDKTHKTHK